MGKRGPAPKGEYANKSSVFSTRIRPDLRASLVAAAKKRGRSLSQEVENRLRRTFIEDEKMEVAFGSRTNFLILRIVGLAMQYANHHPASRSLEWTDDPVAFDTVVKCVGNVLGALRPRERPPSLVAPQGRDEADPRDAVTTEFISKNVAALLWTAVQEADPALPLNRGTRYDLLNAQLKADLGPLAERSPLRPLGREDTSPEIKQAAAAMRGPTEQSAKRTRQLTQKFKSRKRARRKVK